MQTLLSMELSKGNGNMMKKPLNLMRETGEENQKTGEENRETTKNILAL